MKTETVAHLSGKRSFNEANFVNSHGISISVHPHTGRVDLQTNGKFSANVHCLFGSVDEVEDIFNKTLDAIDCDDLLRVSGHKYPYPR